MEILESIGWMTVDFGTTLCAIAIGWNLINKLNKPVQKRETTTTNVL
jgi:hypothetical protein